MKGEAVRLERNVAMLALIFLLLSCMGAAYNESDKPIATDSVILNAVLPPFVQVNHINVEPFGAGCRLIITGKTNCNVSIDIRDNSQNHSLKEKGLYYVNYQDEGYFLKKIQQQFRQDHSRFTQRIFITG